jgi:hypothetical protein
MSERRTFVFFIVVIALMIAGGAGLARQWQERVVLRSELELARMDAADLRRLQLENGRLREKQIPIAELDALRADHAALLRLRAEFAALQNRAVGAKRD